MRSKINFRRLDRRLKSTVYRDECRECRRPRDCSQSHPLAGTKLKKEKPDMNNKVKNNDFQKENIFQPIENKSNK